VSQTKGQFEAKVSEAMMQFQRDQMGRGPDEARSYILGDVILVRLKNVLTPAERVLLQTAEGWKPVKQMRNELLEGSRHALEAVPMPSSTYPRCGLGRRSAFRRS
jgi:uncharacterized protein YbcI